VFNETVTDVLERKLTANALKGTEELVVRDDPHSGLRAAIAIDDTTLGPGLGGVRWVHYESDAAAIAEVQRLGRVMTLKNACAGIPYGGAKSVILSDPATVDRAAVLRAFGGLLAELNGRYVPGVDMGTSVEDLAIIGSVAPDVSCDHDDPSPWTALGIFSGIESAVRLRDGTDLGGHRVVVQGAGHVGYTLCHLLADHGAQVVVADVIGDRAQAIAQETGAEVCDPSDVLTEPCDVFAPCAGARVVTSANVDHLRCRIIAGGANDVLAQRSLAQRLAERSILYVPDFLINAGGVIHIHALRAGWERPQLREAILGIGGTVRNALERAQGTNDTPLHIGEYMASERIGRPITIPD
jgi:leucine dehydrogenase